MEGTSHSSSAPLRIARGSPRSWLLTTIVLMIAVGIAVQVSWHVTDAAGTLPTACSASQLKIALTTNARTYGPGVSVAMATSITNDAPRSCTIAVGPTSPSMTITNAKGVVVWNNCGAGSGLGACPLYMMVRTLNSGGAYREAFRWDQRTGSPASQAPPGPYRLTARFNGAGAHAVSFRLMSASTSQLVVTLSQSGESVRLHLGERLIVRLSGTTNYIWTAVTSSNLHVLSPVSAPPASAGSTSATFVASALGGARVTAIENPNCYPACLPPSRLFTLSVSVIG